MHCPKSKKRRRFTNTIGRLAEQSRFPPAVYYIGLKDGRVVFGRPDLHLAAGVSTAARLESFATISI
jgi:hypothetical protein